MRLIDADALLEEVENYVGCQRYLIPEQIWKILDQQPTAYDVNKVVERLKYAKNPYSDIDLRQYNNALDFAIAVVKRGGK